MYFYLMFELTLWPFEAHAYPINLFQTPVASD